MPTAFISRPFRPETETLALKISCLLKELEIETVDGKWPDSSIPLRDDIVAKIKNCDVLVSLSFSGIPSPWVEQEIGVAIGLGLDVIQLTDEAQPRSGMLAAQSQISLADPFDACIKLVATIKRIKQRRYASSVPTLSANAPIEEYETEGWPREACDLLYQLRENFAASRFDLCLLDARRGTESFPECWRFLICQSAALTHLNKLNEADEFLDKVISDFSREPRAVSYAYDNKAWVLSRRPGAISMKKRRTRLSLLRRAMQAERRLETYVHLVVCLLQLDLIDEAEREFIRLVSRSPECLSGFRQRIQLHGKEYVQAIAKSDLICGWVFPLEEVAA